MTVCDTMLSVTMCYILYTSRTDYARYRVDQSFVVHQAWANLLIDYF
jgi:hypothetical protein